MLLNNSVGLTDRSLQSIRLWSHRPPNSFMYSFIVFSSFGAWIFLGDRFSICRLADNTENVFLQQPFHPRKN